MDEFGINNLTTLSPIEQFGKERMKVLADYIAGSQENAEKIEFLSRCRLENLDISESSLLRGLFSSPERDEKITHLPCLICPSLDANEMTIPIIPIQMPGTVLCDGKPIATPAFKNYIVRAELYGDGFFSSYFSDTACEEHFGIIGSTLPGYLLTEDEAFYLWNCGLLDVLRELIPHNKLGWYNPLLNQLMKVDEKVRTWITGNNNQMCINFGKAFTDTEIGLVDYPSTTFAHPILFGCLDFSVITLSNLKKNVRAKSDAALI